MRMRFCKPTTNGENQRVIGAQARGYFRVPVQPGLVPLHPYFRDACGLDILRARPLFVLRELFDEAEMLKTNFHSRKERRCNGMWSLSRHLEQHRREIF